MGRRLAHRTHAGRRYDALLPCALIAIRLFIWKARGLVSGPARHEAWATRAYEAKPGWQRGWFAQHQRLIEVISSQRKRASVVVEGDFHATAAGKIHRSGELTMAQPVHVVLGGSLGSGDLAFPSSFRHIESTPSQLIGMDQALKPTEKNGFTIVDVTPEQLKFTLFMWRPPQPVEEIDTMQPALVYEVPRQS